MIFENPNVQQAKDVIRTFHDKGIDWDTIRSGKLNGCENYFKFTRDVLMWDLSDEDWLDIIDDMKEVIEQSKSAFIGNPKVELKPIPNGTKTSWQLYKKVLNNNEFTDLSIERIERSTQRIISQLNDSTDQKNPVRGMVVGNVQSGKTASMAGVISMAADYGFNFFIVLTGTIDNLKIQTEERLINDLNHPGNNVFIKLPALSHKVEYAYTLERLNLNENDNYRYLYVCLKNSSRLDDLLAWINDNQKMKKNLKILILDDEADQAGVNTANMSKELVSKINNQIKALVFGKIKKDNKYDTFASPYGAMNYIGYTATPYANFLNEADDKSLYPTNFISTLISPEEYIGPKQIFGLEDESCEGIPIVNEIDDEEVSSIQNNEFDLTGNVHDLSKAIAWFICTVACFRYWELKQPVSMLVHTSQKISDHNIVASLVESIVKKLNKENGLSFIKFIYAQQCKKLDKKRFLSVMDEFPKTLKNKIKEYPDFKYLEPYIKELLKMQTTHIALNEEESKLEYNKGIHLCIDNCSRNRVEENVVFRIIYPDKTKHKEILDYSPAFIVVGGSTLSRGLTLKGLTTSYFIRSTGNADTLMQMGRWFGFRRGYELLPRLWLSKQVIQQFEFLTVLDADLREELVNMETMDMSPTSYGPRLDSFPNFKMLLKITASNKSQNMVVIENDYANKKGQTTQFYDDERIIETNFLKTKDFIESLGPVDKERIKLLENKYTGKNTPVWFNCDYEKVIDFICSLEFPPKPEGKMEVLSRNKKDEIKKWFKTQFENKYLNNFNVVVSSNDVSGASLTFKNCSIVLPSRRRLAKSVGTGIIDLKILTEPNDKLMDINATVLSKTDRYAFDNDKVLKPSEKRIKFGMANTPLLVLYIVNKNSGCNEEDTEERVALHLSQHLVGYHIFIPYGNDGKDKNKTYECEKVSVRLNFLRGEEDEETQD